MKLRFDRFTDDPINTSLIYLRAKIIREGLDGLDHVEALLRLGGCDPDAVRVPPRRAKAFARGELKRLILEAHREGVTYAQLIERLADIGISEREANVRNKLSRGKFSAAFLLACLTAIGARQLHL